jgi:hypothetical protein
MKRACLVLIIGLCLAFLTVPATALTASASITGPSSVRAGNTITLAVNINGTGLVAAQGNLQFDVNKLEYQSVGSKLSGWSVDVNASSGNLSFLAIDDTLTHPINSSKKLFSATFKVKAGLAAGTAISVTGSGFKVSDGNEEPAVSPSNYSITLAAPLSTNADLASLSIKEGSISPAFAKATTNYTLAVAFDISKVTVSASPADANAKVVVNNPELTAGGNTAISVIVTAAAGNTKEYKIIVSRAQDPNYVPGANNSLSGITLSAGQLSPAFSKDVRAYIVYLPYEVDQISAEATPEDSKATVAFEGGTNLQVGQDNLMKVTCTAEDGTAQIYSIYIVRAPVFTGITPTTPTTETTAPTTAATTTATTQTTTTIAQTTTDTTSGQPGNNNGPISTGMLVIIIAVAAIIIFLFGFIVYQSRKRKQ